MNGRAKHPRRGGRAGPEATAVLDKLIRIRMRRKAFCRQAVGMEALTRSMILEKGQQRER